MKIYRISKYILVYLLASGHWNLMVPVIAEEGNGSSGMSSADAGSSYTDGSVSVPAGEAADGSGLAAPAADGSIGALESSLPADGYTTSLSQEDRSDRDDPGFSGGSTSGGDNEVDGISNYKVLRSGAADGAGEPATKLKVFKDDPDGNKPEITETDFYKDQYLDNLTYGFNPGVSCTLVKFGEAEVWKKGDRQVDEPKSVTYNFMHRIVVRDAKRSVVYKKDDSGNWDHYYTLERKETGNSAKTSGDSSESNAAETGSSSSSPKSDDGASTVTPESAEGPKDVDESSDKEADDTSGVTSESPEGENETGSGTGLRGTGASTEASEEAEKTASLASGGDYGQSGEANKEVEAEDSQGAGSSPTDDGGSGTQTSSGEGTQTPDGSADKGASEDAEKGGEGEDGSSQPSGGAPTSGGTVLTGGPDGSASGSPEDGGSSGTPPPSSGGDSSTLGQDGSSATPPGSPAGATNSSNKTGVDLSLKATAATNEFNYNKVGNIVTYTAKDKYAFKSVKTKKGGSSCGSCGSGGSEVTIWDAKDPKEYATKVVLYGKGKKEKKVTIHMPNDDKKVFTRDGKGIPWIDNTQYIKLFKADSNDDTKTKELDSSEYKHKFTLGQHVYEFNDGVNCTIVKRDDKEVWNHDSSKHSGKYPKSLTYNNKDFKIILNFTDLRIVCEKDGDSYKATEYKPKTAVQLDIKQSSETDKFEYKKENNIATFTAKGNYGFNVVRCKNMDDQTWVDIWKTYDENEYSKKVVLEGDNKLTIHIGDDTSASTKVFNKVGYCKWKEDTQASTKKSGTGGSGGGGTGTGGDGSGSPSGGGGPTSGGGGGDGSRKPSGGGGPTSGGGGGDGSGKPSGGGPTSGGTDQSSGQSMPSGGGGPTSGGTDQSGGGTTGTGASGGTDQSGGGKTGTDGSGGTDQSGGGTTGTDGSGGTDQSGGGTTGTDGSGGTDQSGGGTTGTDGSGGTDQSGGGKTGSGASGGGTATKPETQ